MKRIIDGKRYDTGTAILIAEWDNGLYGSDFHAEEESLYRTKNGVYFLAGSGGPMSGYATPTSGGMSGSSTLYVVDENAAFLWLSRHNCVEAIEEHFSEWVSDG